MALRKLRSEGYSSGCVLAGLLAVLISSCSGHVRNTFPPARKYDLDALSSAFTPGPCGMPRDETFTTDIQAGTTFNVTWNLGATHEGGLRVELLDRNYNLIQTLAPADGNSSDWYGDNPAPTRQQVTIPRDITCMHCVLRVLKRGKAASASDPNPWYFNSCSDVNVVNHDITPQCSGHGKVAPGGDPNHCVCDELYAGNICQYKDDCVKDSDCGHGQCIDNDAQSYPKRRCYCFAGHHGSNCMQESPVGTIAFNASDYQMKASKFSSFTFYWRILNQSQEIEVVLQAQGKNWIAIGWRPDGLNTSCKTFPNIRPETTTNLVQGEPVDTVLDYFSPNASTYISGRLHPMACCDIAMVVPMGNLSKVQDFYTRDHGSPREDAVYDGTDSLTAAIASEDPVTGVMTAMFRKPLIAHEPADQSITNGMMHVIWAVGQDPYNPPSAKDPPIDGIGNKVAPKPSNPDLIRQFYRKGEVNEHAHKPQNRGYWSLDLCMGNCTH